jgi:hypothetical protein
MQRRSVILSALGGLVAFLLPKKAEAAAPSVESGPTQSNNYPPLEILEWGETKHFYDASGNYVGDQDLVDTHLTLRFPSGRTFKVLVDKIGEEECHRVNEEMLQRYLAGLTPEERINLELTGYVE